MEDAPVKFVEFDVGASLSAVNKAGLGVQMQYYPRMCGGVSSESYCGFAPCPDPQNSTPWFDKVRFGATK